MAFNLTTAVRRLQSEHSHMKDSQSSGFIAQPIRVNSGGQDFFTWDVIIIGPSESVYENCLLHCVLKFDYEYPLRPPRMYFISEIFHPNIDKDGKICISILESDTGNSYSGSLPQEMWSPVLKIETIIISVLSLLCGPNPDSPANVDAAVMFRNENNKYLKFAREIAIRETKKIKASEQLKPLLSRMK